MPSGFNHFGRLAATLPQVATKLTKKAAFDVQAEAQATVTVKTGFLKSSIYTVASDGSSSYDAARAEAEAKNEQGQMFDPVPTPDPGLGAAQASVVVGAEYGAIHEYGGAHQEGQPYLTPAAERVRPSYEAAWSRLETLWREEGGA